MRREPVLVLHYNELWLKGCNRPFFVSQLQRSVVQTLEDLPVAYRSHVDSRMLVRAETDEAARQAAERLERVPGIQYIGVGWRTANDFATILDAGSELMRGQRFATYRVRARRSDKSLPFRSADIERSLGKRIGEEARAAGREVRVDLKHGEATCYIEATPEGTIVYAEKIRGLGGLPVNTGGRLMCLLSGGIDSAVAAFKILRRGVRLSFVHFHGAPERPGEDSPPVAREIVRQLTRYQGLSRLYLVPFDPIQRAVVAHAPDEFRLLLYRRLMLRIAERVARANRCRGTVTGDSIAQVASQTLSNLEAVGAAATLPVYRPLCGDDKQEIVALARKIGTFEISTEPFTDCCPRFMPRNPRVFSSIDELDAAEARLDAARLVDDAIASIRRETYEYRRGEVSLKAVKNYVSSPRSTDSVLAW